MCSKVYAIFNVWLNKKGEQKQVLIYVYLFCFFICFLVVEGSPYKDALDVAILTLQATGRTFIMKQTWWKEKHGGGRCKVPVQCVYIACTVCLHYLYSVFTLPVQWVYITCTVCLQYITSTVCLQYHNPYCVFTVHYLYSVFTVHYLYSVLTVHYPYREFRAHYLCSVYTVHYLYCVFAVHYMYCVFTVHYLYSVLTVPLPAQCVHFDWPGVSLNNKCFYL